MSKKRRPRNGRTADTARLDFHDWFGKVVDRTKASTTEKEKGIMMLEKIEDRFDINHLDRNLFRQKMQERQEIEFEDMVKESKKFNDLEPNKFTRDERGNIISPFSVKAKKKEN